MAALLSSQIGDTDAVVKYINEARELGSRSCPPTSTSRATGSPSSATGGSASDSARCGTSGAAAIDSIVAAPDASRRRLPRLFDLCARVDLRICNKRVFEALIHAGALDGLGGHRAQYLGGARPRPAGGLAAASTRRSPAKARSLATPRR